MKYLKHIRAIKLKSCVNITNLSMHYLRRVERINLNNCAQITDSGLMCLKNIKNITLTSCTNITDEGLSYLTHVYELKLRDIKITGRGLRNLEFLIDLIIEFCYKLSSEQIKELQISFAH